MAPILHCVRHAQGFHNLGAEFHQLPDPMLTPLGEEQCAQLRAKRFPDQSRISLVTASPLTRTIQTAFLTFKPALKNGKCRSEILALPDAQETSNFPCDTGSDVEVLKAICEKHNWPVDRGLVHPGWNVKTLGTRYSPASDAIKARAKEARKQIRQKARELMAQGEEDPEIVLVTHGGYLHYFTEDWEESDKLNGTGWENTETRAYTFEFGVGEDDEHAHLVETLESRQRRGKEYAMHSSDQQERLFQQSMQGWEDQGLQNPAKIGLSTDEPEARGQEPAAKNMSMDQRSGEVKVMA